MNESTVRSVINDSDEKFLLNQTDYLSNLTVKR